MRNSNSKGRISPLRIWISPLRIQWIFHVKLVGNTIPGSFWSIITWFYSYYLTPNRSGDTQDTSRHVFTSLILRWEIQILRGEFLISPLRIQWTVRAISGANTIPDSSWSITKWSYSYYLTPNRSGDTQDTPSCVSTSLILRWEIKILRGEIENSPLRIWNSHLRISDVKTHWEVFWASPDRFGMEY